MHRGIVWDMVKNPSSQTLPLFEEYTPPLAYLEEVEETLRTLMEEEPMDQTQLEDVGFDSPDYKLSLSSREVPSFDGLEPQPQPLPNCPSLDVSLRDERGTEPSIKPHSLDSYHLTIHTPPSPNVAYYHPGLGNPKKQYGFKLGLLGHRRGLSLPMEPKELGKGGIKETHHLEHIIQQPLFRHKALSHHNGFIQNSLQEITNKVACRLYLMRRSPEAFRKFQEEES
ncbi:hypothetical protein Tco_1024845 [Tanacetum coccineum]